MPPEVRTGAHGLDDVHSKTTGPRQLQKSVYGADRLHGHYLFALAAAALAVAAALAALAAALAAIGTAALALALAAAMSGRA